MAGVQGRGLLLAVVVVAGAGARRPPRWPCRATRASRRPAPADGAELPADLDGIPVTFTLPRSTAWPASRSFATTATTTSTASRSRARTTVGPDRRLADVVAPRHRRHHPRSAPGRLQLRDGAGRLAPAAAGDARHLLLAGLAPLHGLPASYEVGPILRFVIKSPAQMAVRSPAPARAFVGYPIAFPLTLTGVPDGTKVRAGAQGRRGLEDGRHGDGAGREGRGGRRPAEGHAAPAARRAVIGDETVELLRAPGARARREGLADGRGRRGPLHGHGPGAAR